MTDPDVRDAFELAIAITTAVRQEDTAAAVAILDQLDTEGGRLVSLALASLVRKVFAEWCDQAGYGDRSDGVWAHWALMCQEQWDQT